MFKYRIKHFIIRCMIVLLLISIMPAAFAMSTAAVINTSSVKVYQSPTTSSSSVKAVKGISVTVTGYSNGWARISYKGRTGYIKVEYLNLKSRIEAYTYRSTPAYKSASTSSKSTTLSAGTKVYIIGISGKYARVQNKSGSVTVYIESDELVSKSQLSATQSANTTSSTSSKVDKATALAIKYVGRPYGSNEPSSFNCSSLVQYCFGKYGYKVKGTAASIATDTSLKKITSYSSLKRGDILCFDSNSDGKCDHVGIYIGNGYFVEASQNAKKVQINTMSSWYKSHTMWARRV